MIPGDHVIFKYPIFSVMAPREIGYAEIPAGAQLLAVQMQRSQLMLWAKVDPEQAKETRRFQIIGTGNPFNPHGMTYVGTVQDPPFVWHVFEVTA